MLRGILLRFSILIQLTGWCYTALAQKQHYIWLEETDSTAPPLFPAYSYNTDFAEMLDGMLSGVEVSNGNGMPGSTDQIRIRGPQGIEESQGPMIVLDGLPYLGSLNTLNLSDIGRISVIKDAQAWMTYGVRGRNGVIEIQSRQALSNTWKLNLDVKSGFSTNAYSDYEKVTDEKLYYELSWEAFRNTLVRQGYDLEEAGQIASGPNSLLNRYTNPFNLPLSELINPQTGKLNPDAKLRYREDLKELVQSPAKYHDMNLRVRKGGKAGSIYLSANYLNEGGYIRNTGFERFSAHMQARLRPVPWLEAGVQATGSYAKEDFYNGDYRYLYDLAPTEQLVARDTQGRKLIDPHTGRYKIYPESPGVKNPVEVLDWEEHTRDKANFSMQPYLQIRLGSFRLESRYSHQRFLTEVAQKANPYSPIFVWPDLSSNAKEHHSLWKQKLIWENHFNKHSFRVLAGHEYYTGKLEYANTRFYSLDRLKMPGWFGRLTYNYADRYHIFGGLRSEKPLPGSNSYTESWAAGFSWNPGAEPFLIERSINLPLQFQFNYGGTTMPGLAHPYRKTALNAALNWSPANKRIRATVEYFKNHYFNAVLTIPMVVPGVPYWLLNYDFQSSGIDFSIDAIPVKRKNLKWQIGLRLSHYRNRISRFPNPGGYSETYFTYHQGEALQTFKLVRYAGVEEATGSALYYYADGAGQQHTTTDYDLAAREGPTTSRRDPVLFGGLSSRISWKNIALSFRLTFGFGGHIYDAVYEDLFSADYRSPMAADLENRWTPTHTAAEIPAPVLYGSAIGLSDYFLSTASYLNISRLMLSYNFRSLKLRNKVYGLSVYLSVNNLALLSARRGLNPQASFNGISSYAYRPSRTLMLGLHLDI